MTESSAHSDGGHVPAETEVHRLGIADAGRRIGIDRPELERGTPETVAFRIAGAGGELVRDFDAKGEATVPIDVVPRYGTRSGRSDPATA